MIDITKYKSNKLNYKKSCRKVEIIYIIYFLFKINNKVFLSIISLKLKNRKIVYY